MNTFKVWYPGWNDEESACEVKAVDAHQAAEEWVVNRHGNLDYPSFVESVCVKDSSGTVRVFDVNIETVAVGHATERERKSLI
jgi:hypothetical protein